MSRGTKLTIAVGFLAVVHLAVLLAGFFAPYDYAQQDRDVPFAPPSRIHFSDAQGRWHLRPSVCLLTTLPDSFGIYEEDAKQCFPVQFLVRGAQYPWLGAFHSSWHLFGVERPGRIFLMGTDGYGRDVFSRFLYGGQISLFAGLFATFLSLTLGLLLGMLAGFYGGWLDAAIMRGVELFLALPWLYLLFAIRAFLPLNLSPAGAFLLVITVIGTVGWPRPARLIRGMVLGEKERHYVLAARLFGGSDTYLMRRHILPQTYSVIRTQAMLLIPQYILAEITLSFLGLGVAEPAASWGNMLATLQQYHVMVSYWWMLFPALALVPICLSYVVLAGCLQKQSEPDTGGDTFLWTGNKMQSLSRS